MSSIEYLRDADGIVTLTLDAPGEAVNTMNDRFRADLATAVERLEAERARIEGVILTSGKPTFFAGGDLRALSALGPQDAPRFFDELQQMKALLRRLETLGRPVVAAINGSALGGGLEIALSCHHRFCIDDPSIRIGFPEVTLGLLPGAGGVVKTVRLLGIQAALPYLTQGTRLTPLEALRAGFLDALAADRTTLLASARAWIAAHPNPSQPWDEADRGIPGGEPSGAEVASALARYQRRFGNGAQSNYPAPAAILATAIEAARSDFDSAMRLESRHLSELACGQIAKNMIGTLFFQLNEIRAGAGRPADEPASEVARVGIIGAGVMGAAIAAVCASRGIRCLLLDKSLQESRGGKERAAAAVANQVEKGLLQSSKAERILESIQPTQTATDLSGCDLVIETADPNRELEASVTREVEAVLGAEAVLASNTSSLPITELARATSRPRQFVGMHFFSPVEHMQLVEIVRGRMTSTRTVARAYDFALQIGKIPILVNDSKGFYTSRVFGTFANEGMALLGEGVPADVIEEIAVQAGMPAGPLAVLDEISLKLVDDALHQELAMLERQSHGHDHAHASAHHAHDHHAHDDHAHDDHGHDHHAHDHHAHDHHEHGHAHDHHHGHDHEHRHSHETESKRMPKQAVYVLEKMAHGFKRMGRADGGGFYEYPEGEAKHLWPGLKAFERRAKRVPAEEVRERLLYVQSIEAVRCLQEGVLENVRDANIGSIFGWGFPAYTGGAIQLINHVGPSAFVARARELASKHGERFEPPALLVDRAQRGLPL